MTLTPTQAQLRAEYRNCPDADRHHYLNECGTCLTCKVTPEFSTRMDTLSIGIGLPVDGFVPGVVPRGGVDPAKQIG